jgi:predicted metalloprotease with PDZ domain
MKAQYVVDIESPEQNLVKVTLKLTRPEKTDKMTIFLPSWSPGSYLMREYARHIRKIECQQDNGEVLFHTQKAKGVWEIDWKSSLLKKPSRDFQVSYIIYLNELTVRTSHVNLSHAFLHGPTYLMGVLGEKLPHPTIEFRFPPAWAKLSTSLKDVSTERAKFIYEAADYDDLLDCPVEIGCQETDGFMALGKPHNLAFYGTTFPHNENLKKDMKTIVETVAAHFNNELPYEQYLFLTHFGPKIRGGLEHASSTVLQYDGRKLGIRKEYVGFLSLVAHEFFHTWNVKRIRPKELGPFDYLNENYTTLLWLAEGLTSWMDDLLVYRAGLCTIEEYLEQVKQNIEILNWTSGRKFHTLEMSSFNAWIKLYRPDENSKNSSVSYYLKGGLVFMVLHSLLLEKGKSVDDLLLLLWDRYKKNPETGVTREEVYEMVKALGGEDVLNSFSTMVETTQDPDFESTFRRMGCEMVWQESKVPFLGIDWEFAGDRAFAKMVYLDSPAYKAGINPGDEVIFLNGLRFLREDAQDLISLMNVNTAYEFIISRLGKVERFEVIPSGSPRILKEIRVKDKALADRAFYLQKKSSKLA